MTTVIEAGRVAPPPGAVAEQSLPLTFFDMMWIHFHPMLQLLFYDLPISKPHFLETIVPKLKQSLSLTLKHFFPFSGYVVYPLSPEEMPVFRYRSGDSIPFTISECSDDFDDLVGNHAQSADKFYGLIPQLSPIVEESDHKLFQVLAVQVTLFVGRGISVGITTHHCVSDAQSFLGFLKSWAAISKSGGDDEDFLIKNGELLPVFDRSLINYPLKLDSFNWKNTQKRSLQSHHPTLPTNCIRSIYSFTPSEIKKIKNSIQEKVPSLVHLSSFVAMAAFIWTTLAKSLTSEADVEAENDDDAFFLIPIDLRPRLDPPVPENYFGNCISYALPRVGRRKLAGDEGLFLAAEAMAAEIKKRTCDKNILETMEKWMGGETQEAKQKSFFSVSGSTRLDLYGSDFGWGRARKQEILSIDGEKYSMTLCKSRDFEGGLEVCLSLPKEKMDAFDAYFSKGMKE